MSVIVVDDLHLAESPRARLARKADIARVRAGTETQRLIVRAPDRQTDGIRVLREQDIARLLRRHGRISEIGTTDGGTIVAAADLCDRRGEVAVWTGYAIGPWHPTDITTRGLGGSETAAVRLAEELAAMGYIVTLYGQFEQEGLVGDVLLRDFQAFDPTEPLDALVALRNAKVFDRRPNARFCALWLEDLPGPNTEGLDPDNFANVDRVCAVSRWHKAEIERVYPWIDPKKVAACRNGIVPGWFLEEPAPERERRVVFSSSPDRGGDIMLELWPIIREEVPDATLVLTYSRWYDIVAERYPLAFEHRERMKEMLDQPGVHRVEGGLGQKALANLLRSSMVWAHPSWYSAGHMAFDETNCIACQEAQMAGCVVVASNWGALTEMVMHGTLIDGDPTDPDGSWRRAFVDAIVEGLTNPRVQRTAQELGPEYMKDRDWRGATEQLAAMFPGARKRVKA